MCMPVCVCYVRNAVHDIPLRNSISSRSINLNMEKRATDCWIAIVMVLVDGHGYCTLYSNAYTTMTVRNNEIAMTTKLGNGKSSAGLPNGRRAI